RKASVYAPAADPGPVLLKVALVYLAPDDGADERAREGVEAATREVARSLDVLIREAEPDAGGDHGPGDVGHEAAAREAGLNRRAWGSPAGSGRPRPRPRPRPPPVRRWRHPPRLPRRRRQAVRPLPRRRACARHVGAAA